MRPAPNPLTLLVPGMTCRHCVRTVTAVLRDVPGVTLVTADLDARTVVLHGHAAEAEVLAALAGGGFPGTLVPALRLVESDPAAEA